MGGKLFGFRSNVVWKKALAIIWYAGWLVMAVAAAIAEPSPATNGSDVMVSRLAGAFLFVGIAALPLLLSAFPFLKKVPLLGDDRAWQKAIGLVVFALIWLVLFGAINTLHSDEYKAAIDAQAAQQQAEQEARRAEEKPVGNG